MLISLAALAATGAWGGEAAASALSRIKLDYRGYFTGVAGGVEKNGTVPEVKDSASRSATALRFKASTLFDNGIKIAFNTSFGLDGEESLVPNRGHIEDIYLELGTFFGTFTVGRQDGVAAMMRVRTPSPIYGVYTENTELDMLELANVATKLDLSGYNAKLTYQTPRIQGLQLGASYLVEDVPSGVPVHVTSAYDRRKSGAAGATEAGINYTGKVGNISLGAAATYYADNHDGIGERDPRGYNVGVELGLNGWTLGGNFTAADHVNHATVYSNNTRTTAWSAGLTYANGAWQLGGLYAHGADDPPAPTTMSTTRPMPSASPISCATASRSASACSTTRRIPILPESCGRQAARPFPPARASTATRSLSRPASSFSPRRGGGRRWRRAPQRPFQQGAARFQP
ncbi:MAG: porin [Alphaproteobacteria bacterium]